MGITFLVLLGMTNEAGIPLLKIAVGSQCVSSVRMNPGYSSMGSSMLCQECHQGKHRNCEGIAGLDERDQPIPCDCDSEEAHPLRGEPIQ